MAGVGDAERPETTIVLPEAIETDAEKVIDIVLLSPGTAEDPPTVPYRNEGGGGTEARDAEQLV